MNLKSWIYRNLERKLLTDCSLREGSSNRDAATRRKKTHRGRWKAPAQGKTDK